MLGAFATWAFSGFRGKYEDHLENSKGPINGLLFLLALVAVIIIIGRLT